MKKNLFLFLLFIFFTSNVQSQISFYQGGYAIVEAEHLQNQCGAQPITVGMQGLSNYYEFVYVISAVPVNQMTIPVASLGQAGTVTEMHKFDAEGITNETVSVSSGCSSLITINGIDVSNTNASHSIATSVTVYSPSKFTAVRVSRMQGMALIVGPASTITYASNELSAQADSAVVPFGLNSTAVETVLYNDYYYSQVANFSNVNLSFISSTHAGVTLNTTTGAVNVTSNVPVGTYSLVYKICSLSNPTVCMNATVTVKVSPSVKSACWQSIGVANYATVAVRDNGTLWSWGNGGNSLGDGTFVDRNFPVQVGTDTNWSKVFCPKNGSYVCAIKTDGTLWTWGSFGVFGNSSVPIQIGTANDWKTMSLGQYVAVLIKNDGTLWVQGQSNTGIGNIGQLGLGGSISYVNVLTQIGTDSDWKSVSTADSHVLAIKENGTLWSWGRNQWGQTGLGITSYVPAQVGTDTDWKVCEAGGKRSNVIKNNGTLWFCGAYQNGQFGNGTANTLGQYTLTQVGTATNWKSVYCGSGGFTAAVKTNGTLWSWGIATLMPYASYAPVQIGSNDWEDVIASGGSSLVRKTNGSIYITGYNGAGTYGNGTNETSSVYVQISNCVPPTPITAVDDNGSSFFGTASVAVSNVLSNDTHNGIGLTLSGYSLSLISSSNPGITLNTSTGAVSVAANVPVGSYTLVYQVCEIDYPTNCDTATVTICVSPNLIAQNDSFVLDCPGQNFRHINVKNPNPTSPDTMNGSAITSSLNTTYEFIPGSLSPVPVVGSVGISSSGTLVTNDHTSPGYYTFQYRIKYLLNGCTTYSNVANVTVVIPPSPITSANNDTGVAVSGTASVAVANVLSNDVYTGNVILGTISSTDAGITLNTTTGALSVNANVTPGIHQFVYKICSPICPTDCRSATVTLDVATPNIVFGTRANNLVVNIGLQTNGKIIISGPFTAYNNISANSIARLKPDLTLDSGFNLLGGSYPQDLVVLSDNKILIVGSGQMNSFSGTSISRGITRLLSNGDVDADFNPGGIGIFLTNKITTIAIQPNDQKILIGGEFITSYNGIPVKTMIRLLPNGGLDTTFNYPFDLLTAVNSNSGTVSRIALQNGKILVGGVKNPISGGQPNLFRLLADGEIDPTFTTGDTGVENFQDVNNCNYCLSPIQKILVLPDNSIIVAGSFDTYNGQPFKNIVKLNQNGGIDYSFNPQLSANKVISDVIYDPVTLKIYISGQFNTYNGTTANYIARINPNNGQLDSTFSPGSSIDTAVFPDSRVIREMYRQTDQKIILGGYFATYNGISATNVTRINPSIAGAQAKNPEENELQLLDDNVVVYPNPSKDVFNFDFSKATNSYDTIKVYNMMGAVLIESPVDGLEKTIDLSRFADGYYFVRVFGEVNSMQFKLIKK